MEFAAIVTLLTIALNIYMLGFTRVNADVVHLMTLVILTSSGILDVVEAFDGFTTSAALTLALLTVIVKVIQDIGGMDYLMTQVCGRKVASTPRVLLRLMATSSLVSTVISNTVVATVFFDPVAKWSKKHGIAPSKVILPICYAIALGSCCTIIGTGNNLLICDMYHELTGQTISFFEPFAAGFMLLIVGIAYIMLTNRLFPNNATVSQDLLDEKSVMVEMLVPSDNKYVGKQLSEIEALNACRSMLVKLYRFDQVTLSPIPADEFLMGGDRLAFYGNYDMLVKLRERLGFVCSPDFVMNTKEYRERPRLQQNAIVTSNSSLSGKRMMDMGFEKKYGVTLMALMRHNERMTDSPRETVIRDGDMLVFEGSGMPWDEVVNDMLPYGNVRKIEPDRKQLIALGLLLAIIVGSCLGLFSIITGSCVVIIILAAMRCLGNKEAWNYIPWSQLILFAGSTAIANAINRSDLDDMAADWVLGICGGSNALMPLMFIVGLSLVLKVFVSSYAIVAIFVPVSVTVAELLGCSAMPFLMGIMFSTAYGFATPYVGAMENMAMTYGNYTMKDMARFGIPFTLVIYATSIFACLLFYS